MSIQKRELPCDMAVSEARHACLCGYHKRKNLLWFVLELQILLLSETWWTLPCQMLLAQRPLLPFFYFHNFCFIDFMLLCVKVVCWGGFSLHQGKDFILLFFHSLQDKAWFCAHNRWALNVKNEMVAVHEHGEPGLCNLLSPVRSILA